MSSGGFMRLTDVKADGGVLKSRGKADTGMLQASLSALSLSLFVHSSDLS